MPFFDSDEWLETRAGETGANVAARDGVGRLHEIELDIFLDMTDHNEEAVIAPAASVVDHEAGRNAMAENLTVWLTAPDPILEKRQGKGSHRRDIEAEAHRLLQRRRAPYLEAVATLKLDTGELTAIQVVDRLIEMMPESVD